MALIISIVAIVFGLLCMAGALFGKGERGTISCRVRRVMLFLAGLVAISSGILRFYVSFMGMSIRDQYAATARAGHGACAEDGEAVGYPLKGWVGYTNTGESVPEMTVQALVSPDKPPVAMTKTDTVGRFSLPTLSPGRYYLRAAKIIGGAKITADDVVTVSRGKIVIACLVAEAEASEQSPQQ